jgi:hypothetical protein
MPIALSCVLDEFRELLGSRYLAAYFSRPECDLNGMNEKVQKFLRCTMDEVRLHYARECSQHILKVADLDDLEMLREGVLKREASGTISFPGQRDHTAHTLNNWLLGWYFYTHCPLVRDSIGTSIGRRGWDENRFSNHEFFGHVWQYVSLLHDVGYLFEGSVAALDSAGQSDQALVGIHVLDDYYNARLWIESNMASVHHQRNLFKELGFTPPDLRRETSIARIARALRNLTDLRGDITDLAGITSFVSQDCRRRPGSLADLADPKATLPGDAFDLWRAHYGQFGTSTSVNRITAVERAFEGFAHIGLPKLGIRILDHGVCSGLILLQISTLYYDLQAKLDTAMSRKGPLSPALQVLADNDPVYDYDPAFWWTGIVWATAATAIHNVQQMSKPWFRNFDADLLSLEEDPLAFLGILVDCLQEWDRYFVFALPDRLPVQGADVLLGHEDGRIIINFAESERAAKVAGDLKKALAGWENVVSILPA